MSALFGLFASSSRREAEILILRQQLAVLRRKAPGRARISLLDRFVLVWLFRFCPVLLDSILIVKPETVVRWHRNGFRFYWRWKSRNRRGRPKVDAEIRNLIRRISLENPLWGAPRIHGELLKLGIDTCQSTVAKYMVKRPRSGVENIPQESQGRYRFFGFPCSSDRWVQDSILPHHIGSRSKKNPVDRCDLSSNVGVGCETDYRSFPVGGSS